MSERTIPEPVLLGLFVLAAPLAYLSVLDAFFVSDDFLLLRALRDGGPLALWFRDDAFLRPLVCLSLALDLKVWGLTPVPFHLTNVLIHAVNSWLVVRLARRWMAGLNLPSSAPILAGEIFLVLPSHAEAVTWISGRTDLLACFFALVSLDRYHAWREHGKPMDLAGSLSAFGAALLCKESVVILPGILLAHELLAPGHGLGSAWRRCVAHVGVLGLYLVVRLQILQIHTPLNVSLADAAENAVLHALKTLTTYWPQSFATLRLFLITHKAAVSLILGLALSGFLARLVLRWRQPGSSRKTLRCSSFLLTAWGVALIPVIPLSTRLFTSESDRFLYFPSAFACVLLVIALGALVPRRAFVVAGVVLLVLYIGLLWRVNDNWLQAGKISRAILEQVRSEPGTHNLEILSLPDNLAGAYIFRNGFSDALALFPGPAEARLLSTYEMLGTDEMPEARATGDGLALTLGNPRAAFSLSRPSPGCAVARLDSPLQLKLDLGACDDPDRVIWFQSATMIRQGDLPPLGTHAADAAIR